MKKTIRGSWYWLVGILLLCLTLRGPSAAPTDGAEAEPAETTTAAAAEAEPVTKPGHVTLNAEDALVSQILNAFSRQTGRSIVIGPEITGRTTVRLNNVPWDEALEAVLRPFGYGHFEEGGATVVTGVDPVQSQVITLKFVDASDVEGVLASFLSPRGKISRLTNLGQSWGSAASQSESVAGGEGMGKRSRFREDPLITRSKTLVVSDTPAVLNRITTFLEKVDRPPMQVLIEARFLEVNPRVLRDLGLEFNTAGGFTRDGHTYGYGADQVSGEVAPGNFTPFSAPSLNPTAPFNGGVSLAFRRLTSVQYEVLFHALQEDASADVLSAPRILTLNNQEAVIIVGQKYPIINSDASTGSGVATITTSLRGYEDIGIQLNVLPQICDGDFINMIVRPSVRELVGTKSGKTVSGETTALTEYPVISTREAETQVVLPNGNTVVIGGLLKDRQSKTVIKVPLLGDIPWIGWLFRRETMQNEKIELLIFVTASIVPPEGSELNLTEIDSMGNRAPTIPDTSVMPPVDQAAPRAATEPAPVPVDETSAMPTKAQAVESAREEEQALADAKEKREAAAKAEAQARAEAEAKAAAEAKEKARLEAQAQKEAAEKAALAAKAEAKARAEAEAKAAAEAKEKARLEAQAQKEAAEKAALAAKAEAKARAEAEAKAAAEAKEKARLEAQAQKEAAEKAALAAKAEAKARAEAEAKAAAEAKEKARLEAQAQKEAAEKAALAAKAEAKARAEAEAKAAAEAKAEAKAIAKAKEEAEAQAVAAAKAEAQARKEAAEKATLAAKAEAKARAEAEAKAAAEAKEKARLEAQAQKEAAEKAALAAKAEAKARAEAEAKAAAEAKEKARLEARAQKEAAEKAALAAKAEAKARAEAEAKAAAEAKEKARLEAQAQKEAAEKAALAAKAEAKAREEAEKAKVSEPAPVPVVEAAPAAPVPETVLATETAVVEATPAPLAPYRFIPRRDRTNEETR
jgi:type II secretory pathway component GspD/PulD (secretin)